MSINDISRRQPGDIDLADAMRAAKRRVDEHRTPAEKLAAEVNDMGKRSEAAIRLLGEICATFSIERNREAILRGDLGAELLEIADGWVKRYNRIVPAECTEISANWCPIHGDCTCSDPGDKNDDDCPLHSVSSIHGKESS